MNQERRPKKMRVLASVLAAAVVAFGGCASRTTTDGPSDRAGAGGETGGVVPDGDAGAARDGTGGEEARDARSDTGPAGGGSDAGETGDGGTSDVGDAGDQGEAGDGGTSDAGEAGDGGFQIIPTVRCGTEPLCSTVANRCCHTYNSSTSVCQPQTEGCFPSSNVPITCDSASDCTAGQVCCLYESQTGSSVFCSPTCVGSAVSATQVCAPGNTSECRTGTCIPTTNPALPSDYWTCQ